MLAELVSPGLVMSHIHLCGAVQDGNPYLAVGISFQLGPSVSGSQSLSVFSTLAWQPQRNFQK